MDSYEVELVCRKCGRIFDLPDDHEVDELVLCPQGHPVDPEKDQTHWPDDAEGVDVPLPDFDGR